MDCSVGKCLLLAAVPRFRWLQRLPHEFRPVVLDVADFEIGFEHLYFV